MGHKLYREGFDLSDPHWQRRGYEPFLAYGSSKMANALMARELSRR